jgi:hypothetical protein
MVVSVAIGVTAGLLLYALLGHVAVERPVARVDSGGKRGARARQLSRGHRGR